jgi:hypothetical protein
LLFADGTAVTRWTDEGGTPHATMEGMPWLRDLLDEAIKEHIRSEPMLPKHDSLWLPCEVEVTLKKPSTKNSRTSKRKPTKSPRKSTTKKVAKSTTKPSRK